MNTAQWHACRGVWLCAALLAGCGASDPVDPPPGPSAGTERPGTVYAATTMAADGLPIAFQVFEPALVRPALGHPLVLHGHGFGNSRALALNPAAPGDIDALVAAGYGVISVDQRGHGDSGGLIRVMDPDHEGSLLLAVLDWAETHLDWLAYDIQADGERNLKLGSIGTSYGGMAQLVLQAIDPQQRLDAMLIQNAPYDLPRSLFPNGVHKSIWHSFFRLVGEAAGNGLNKGNLDPFVRSYFEQSPGATVPDQDAVDFFRYHSHAYFCEGAPVATNGGPGTRPHYPPRLAQRPLHALLFQGPRDTLFPLNEMVDNAECLRRRGGDVRMLSYQSGHNTLLVDIDPGIVHDPAGPFETRCGSTTVRDALLRFFDHHLRGNTEATDALPRGDCISLSSGDAVLLPEVPRGRYGPAHPIAFSGILGGLPDLPQVIPLDVEIPAEGAVLAGLPHAELEIEAAALVARAPPLLLFGLGVQKAPDPSWRLIDNQLLPWRGSGRLDQSLIGVGERLNAADRLGLLLYGAHSHYLLEEGGPAAVTVNGRLWLPLLTATERAP